jgi:hypothetical protein
MGMMVMPTINEAEHDEENDRDNRPPGLDITHLDGNQDRRGEHHCGNLNAG